MASAMVGTQLVSETEQRVLDLHDRLQQLSLERALLKARREYLPDADESGLGGLQEEALQAKATVALRDQVVENVLLVQPLLNAVHHATHASPIERDLSAYIQKREQAAKDAARQDSEMQATKDAIDELDVLNRASNDRNAGLAAEILQLVEAAARPSKHTVPNAHIANQTSALEDEVKSSRQRWKIMKGTASAIVAGSGLDWVRDERLRDMVVDSTNDEF
ncbi:centromere protein H (CENP-H)-domain-containing protein [Schizothecium vesticola]|uniref:Centromere protein H (CENP-H)-domain-containing protein n=1 Tax=Schizothecium vesticola TaxID=314040 RepID=A0AA40FAE5_9PEZI|nr:centromere protein H (CENP-H)-domain-containing protein [Schizothecium vesticola]